mmetsp:Transcript_17556/g.40230  ORF Transcript_17556/g.40230 Transcript_17556/m.40230 type:complete len:232 (-) Transcript_17556:129-824(-)
MAPPSHEDRSPDEEPLRYLIDDSFGIPLFDPLSPVVGFSHDAHDPIVPAHNTTLGDTAQVHRQPLAATEFRDPFASGLSATPTTCLAPSHVTRARDEQESSVQSLPSSMPTHPHRPDVASESATSDDPPFFSPAPVGASAIPPYTPLAPTSQSAFMPPPGTASSHRHMPPPLGVDVAGSGPPPLVVQHTAPPPPFGADVQWPPLPPPIAGRTCQRASARSRAAPRGPPASP